MFSTKRKCADVDLSNVSTRSLRLNTKRSKSTELLTSYAANQMKVYDFSKEDYGEQFQQKTHNGICNQADIRRQFLTATRRLNKSRERSLDVCNDNTFVKQIDDDSQPRRLPPTPVRQIQCKNISPVWKSTPSLTTMYSSSNGYCRYSNTSNSNASNDRWDMFCNEIDKSGQEPSRTNAKQPLNKYIQNRILSERNLAMLEANSTKIVDPLARGNILSPGYQNNQANNDSGVIPSCICQSQNDIRNVMNRDINGPPLCPGLSFNVNGRSVEMLDVNLDISPGADSPDSRKHLLDVHECSKDIHPRQSSHVCSRQCCSKVQCTSYKIRFYVVLVLNLLLILLNICGIPAVFEIYKPGQEPPDRMHCVKCSDLNQFCELESLGFLRKPGDQCCVVSDRDTSLYTAMLKTTDAYIDCSVGRSQESELLPIVQYSVDANNALRGDQIIKWNEYPDMPPLDFGHLVYNNSKIIIPRTGYYYIYTQMQFKKQPGGNSSIGFSIMKNDKQKNETIKIDKIEENPFGEGVLQLSPHSSHLITLHNFSKEENLFVKVDHPIHFDKSSKNTKIIIFYVNLERPRHKLTKNATSTTTNN